MAQFKVNISNGSTASVGDQVAYWSDTYGVRVGKVIALSERESYGGRTRVAIKIKPDRAAGGSYFSPVTIYKATRVFKLAAPVVAAPMPQAFAPHPAPAPQIPSRY